ncbi:methyltransferase domain-containing protein [Streptomyces xanthophaeus]|uniref:methyltransferase domain-containing protein n=1 Tax=Streptomyces xanthophaeus TaxID=67385 RepID=UPI003650BD66
MAVVILEHTQGEAPGALGGALAAARLDVRAYRAWAGELPDGLGGVDALVLADGPAADRAEDGAELALLREALAAEVPVLGVRRGAHLVARAAGDRALPGPVRNGLTVERDPLFADEPAPPSATALTLTPAPAPDRSHPVRAFRIGGSAWGLHYPVEVDLAAPDTATRPALAALEAWRDRMLARFAALVATRAERTAARTFFTRRAGAWEDRFAYQAPLYAAAVARMGLRPGQTALDLGCGTGRAMPALRAQVGGAGAVLGVDVTHAMLTAAARIGRSGCGHLLLADCTRLPLPGASVHGIFAAGLLDHLPRPHDALREWARVSAADGTLLLFHPSGRAERAARHGRPLDPDDLLAEPNLRQTLESTGWRLTLYEDAAQHFVARATPASAGVTVRR